MVQVLPYVDRGPSLGQRLAGGLARGLQAGQEAYTKHQTGKKLQELTGQDLSDVDPELQKAILVSHLQGQNELKKQQMKEQLLEKKLSALGGLFGGHGQRSQNMGKQLAGNVSEDQEAPSQGIDPSQISDDAILQLSAIDPQLGNAARGLKDTALREKRAAQKLKLEEKKLSPEFKREQSVSAAQAQADVKYNQALQEQERQGKLKTQSLENLERLNKKGVTGKPFEKLLEKGGLTALTSEGRREFAADVKNLITDIRSILGAQFTGFEFQTILNAYPSADFSKEANEAIIRNLKEFQDIKNKEVQFARDIKKENGGQIPQDFQSLVNERVNAYAQSKLPEIKQNTRKVMNEEYGIKSGNVLMFDPSGEPLEVSPNDIEYYESLGATLP